MAPGGHVDKETWRDQEDNAWRQTIRSVFPAPRMQVANNSPFADIRGVIWQALK